MSTKKQGEPKAKPKQKKASVKEETNEAPRRGGLGRFLFGVGLDLLEEHRAEVVTVAGAAVSKATRAVASGEVGLKDFGIRVGVGRPAEARKGAWKEEPVEPSPDPAEDEETVSEPAAALEPGPQPLPAEEVDGG